MHTTVGALFMKSFNTLVLKLFENPQLFIDVIDRDKGGANLLGQ